MKRVRRGNQLKTREAKFPGLDLIVRVRHTSHPLADADKAAAGIRRALEDLEASRAERIAQLVKVDPDFDQDTSAEQLAARDKPFARTWDRLLGARASRQREEDFAARLIANYHGAAVETLPEDGKASPKGVRQEFLSDDSDLADVVPNFVLLQEHQAGIRGSELGDELYMDEEAGKCAEALAIVEAGQAELERRVEPFAGILTGAMESVTEAKSGLDEGDGLDSEQREAALKDLSERATQAAEDYSAKTAPIKAEVDEEIAEKLRAAGVAINPYAGMPYRAAFVKFVADEAKALERDRERALGFPQKR